MSRNSDIRRELGMGMPTPARDMASERYSITHTSNEPEQKKELVYQFVGGVIMVNDGDGWRLATEEEIQELTGGLMCYELHDHVTLLGKS